MPNWNQILSEITQAGSTYDSVRRRYIAKLHEQTDRNVILYYSGWLQKPERTDTEINDGDKNGFMTVIHGLDRSKGLDLILHTPGGEVAATESIIDYLTNMFPDDIRAIVPQIAMSGGTMIACACNEIMMGKHSSLGPIDPHIRGIPAHGIKEEFETARKEIKEDPTKIPIWQPILAKYPPAFVGECEKAIEWSKEIVIECLMSGMFRDKNKVEKEVKEKVEKIVSEMGNHAITKSHARHFSADRCREIGLEIRSLEKDQYIQEAVLSIHHACMHTLAATPACKLIENHNGVAFIRSAG